MGMSQLVNANSNFSPEDETNRIVFVQGTTSECGIFSCLFADGANFIFCSWWVFICRVPSKVSVLLLCKSWFDF